MLSKDNMKTLLIIDKAGQIGLQYAIVDGDYSKFAGLVLNKETAIEKECVEFFKQGLQNNTIQLVDNLSYLKNKNWNKEALICYY